MSKVITKAEPAAISASSRNAPFNRALVTRHSTFDRIVLPEPDGGVTFRRAKRLKTGWRATLQLCDR
jgi:hypothetical protein